MTTAAVTVRYPPVLYIADVQYIIVQNYGFPGGLAIDTESHFPNACGLQWCRCCRCYGQHCMGTYTPQCYWWTTPKGWYFFIHSLLLALVLPNVVFKVVGVRTVKGSTCSIVEYKGPGVESFSCRVWLQSGTWVPKSFRFNNRMVDYLNATKRSQIGAY